MRVFSIAPAATTTMGAPILSLFAPLSDEITDTPLARPFVNTTDATVAFSRTVTLSKFLRWKSGPKRKTSVMA